MQPPLNPRRPLAAGLLMAATAALAQTGNPPPTAAAAPASAASAAAQGPPAAAPAPTAAPAARATTPGARPAVAPSGGPAAGSAGQQVEITGGRESDTNARRQATAAKIVIGREEIDKFGDTTLGEVLRRLPGVTTPGAPGRGGPPRMRGLGAGFTQLLIDGQRMPPGFSLESLSPEQVERIEILRAPTAETGARAIAGTINIITREGYRRRLNDLRLGYSLENGETTPGIFWTHNDSSGPLTYNISAAHFRPHRRSSTWGESSDVDLGTGALVGLQNSQLESLEQRRGLNLTSRLQWRLSDSGDMLLLMPSVFHSQGGTERKFSLTQTLPAPPALSLYDHGTSDTVSRFTSVRLGSQWRQRLGAGTRVELNAGVGMFSNRSATDRDEYRNGQPLALRHFDDDSRTSEKSANLTLKFSSLLGGNEAQPGTEHSLVSGVEFEGVNRSENRTQLQNGQPLLLDFGDNLKASTLRGAAYVQDEWNLTPNWALHAGLRWEGIDTRGEAANGTRPGNRSSVWTPLLHLLWKPDIKKRDQIRLSLTRSYRSPTASTLIAKPTINSRYPTSGGNEPTAPDSAGNPALLPELATGLDLAYERYLEGGGVLSVNLFHRQISQLMRSVVKLETVSYSSFQRWVSRQQNIGDATTQGIELEAKYRLDQLLSDAPRIEMRHNLSLYRSRVQGIPGPDNRLDSQAPASANIGADYRLRGTPLTLGGNANWVPGYDTRLSLERSTRVGAKTVLDAFALWTVSPTVGVRLLGSNLGARDYESSNRFDTVALNGNPLRETARSGGPSYTNWQLRLELKL